MISTADSSLIAGYIAIVLVIGYFSSRRQSGAGFMIAERRLGLVSLFARQKTA